MGLTHAMPDPGEQQDSEAAREKLLKAADQLDMIQANSETEKASVEAMKADIVKLQEDNAALKQQIASLQDAVNASETARQKERQVMLDQVATMIAAGKLVGSGKAITAKKKDSAAVPPLSKPPPPVETAATGGTDPAAEKPADSSPTQPAVTDPAPKPSVDNPPAKAQKGYYHIVEAKETLTLICSAYRQEGVNVTIAQIQKANGLTDKSVLKIGQKLFIPKPGT